MNSTAFLAVCLSLALCSCSDPPAPTINVNCYRPLEGDISIDCSQTVESSATPIPVQDAGTDADSPPCTELRALASPWTSDGGESSIGQFVVQPEPLGDKWSEMFALSSSDVLRRIDVAVRPFATPPTIPAKPVSIELFRGDDLTDEGWSLVASVEDDTSAPSFGGPRVLSLIVPEQPASASLLHVIRLLPAFGPTSDGAAIVVESVPYLTLDVPCN